MRLHDLEHPFAAAEMYGKVLNIGSDLPAGHIKDLSIFKNTTGGDPIEANRKYGRKFKFTNHALSVFTANEISTVGELSGAYFDRMHPVHFGNSFAGQMDPTVEERLRAERDGIFRRWMLAFQQRLARPGAMPLPAPEDVMARFQTESDPVRMFLAERMVPEGTVEPGRLYSEYRAWCSDGGRQPLGERKFAARVADAGYHSRKSNGRRVVDLRLRRDDDPEPGEHVQPTGGLPVRRHESSVCETCRTMALDIETGAADRLFVYPVSTPYVRLLSIACEHGSWVTADRDEMIERLSRDGVTWVGHNIHQFDVLAIRRCLGVDVTQNSIDTLPAARLVEPPLTSPTAHKRRPKPVSYALDDLCTRAGIPGKSGSIDDLARQWGRGAVDPFLAIPVDDPDYLDYARQDAAAAWGLWQATEQKISDPEYHSREQRLSRLASQMRWQGLGVDQEALLAREDADQEAQQQRAHRLRAAGIEVDKKLTRRGKLAVPAVLGVELPRDKNGAPLVNKKTLAGVEHPLAADLLALNADRGLPAQLRSFLAPDGRVHATMDMSNQASGRWSVTDPGLTTWGKRGAGKTDRALFCAEPGHVLVSADLTSIDVCGMAALSQDQDMIRRLKAGDWHREMADLLFGDRSDAARARAKAASHAINYNAGAGTLAELAGITEVEADKIIDLIRRQFPDLHRFKERRVREAATQSVFDNGWGRPLRTHQGEEYTSAPGLSGQRWARDAAMACLLRLDDAGLSQYIVLHIHDEFIFEIPADRAEELRTQITEAMTFERDGVPIRCQVSPPARSWSDL